MKVRDLVGGKDIVLVSGKLCSGKGHYCTTNYPDHFHLPVSTVVKQLANTQSRSELAKTASLDDDIVQALIREIDNHPRVVVDGIRQVSVVRALQNQYGNQITDIIWLGVPDNTRRARFAARRDVKDDVDFDTASAGDVALGIDDVERHFSTSGRVVSND